ncbi:hypothetical protein AC1031_020848 [Aphanomyces cochlioides]|nr:hypothetical protein AC1031_020848 [Aphanomyces cochlioides]
MSKRARQSTHQLERKKPIYANVEYTNSRPDGRCLILSSLRKSSLPVSIFPPTMQIFAFLTVVAATAAAANVTAPNATNTTNVTTTVTPTDAPTDDVITAAPVTTTTAPTTTAAPRSTASATAVASIVALAATWHAIN